MRVQASCRSCGPVVVDAGDVHVHLKPCGFGPTADVLCPGCGGRGWLGIGEQAVQELVPHGALLVDGEREPGPLGPHDAAELRDLLVSDLWYEQV